MSEQNKLTAEKDVKNAGLSEDLQKAHLGFLRFLRDTEFSVEAEDDGNGWKIIDLNACVGHINFANAGIWIDACDFGGVGWADEALKETTWAHVRVCEHFSSNGTKCGCGRQPGFDGNLFGKEYKNLCFARLEFINPDIETLESIKKLMLSYRQNKKNIDMTPYELMVKTNHYLIKGGELTGGQKENIVRRLLAAKSTTEQAARFYTGVRFPGNTDTGGRKMYPEFFIPPYNGGEKYRTVLGQTPKTHILSANLYELEILRLLHLFTPDDPEIKNMTGKTLARLKTTCFGSQDDGVGECFDANLVVLRFLAAAAPRETDWINGRIENYNRHANDKKRPWFSRWYFWLYLSELPFELAKPEVDKYKREMAHWLDYKSCVMNSESDRIIHPTLLCILRNNLARYPEYAHIKDRQPFVSERDGRLHFDTEK